MNCPKCGKEISKIHAADMCQSCYNYFRLGGIVHPLPAAGTIQKDADGKIICHICGRAYKRLGSHAKESHGMTIDEYKAEFGLCRRAQTTESDYHETMRQHALDNDMDKQLLLAGKDTRITAGTNYHRKGKDVRLQEILMKRTRKKVK